jgi:hypothetical protein
MAALFAGCANPPRDVASAKAGTAATASAEFAVETLRRAIAVEAGVASLYIDNPHGELRLRLGQPGEVGIVATVQVFGAEGPRPEFAQLRKGDALHIAVRYPFAPPPVDPATGRADHTRGRADLAVFVPPDVALDLSTTDGRIQVRRARRDVVARSDSGIVDVSSAGALRIATGSGRVVARLESDAWAGRSTIETDSGPILLALPVAGDVALTIEAAGAVSHDPGLALELATTSDGHRSANGRWGKGSHTVVVRSTSGPVHVVPVLAVPGGS